MTTTHDTELTVPWRTSSRSGGGNECVEVAQTRDNCLVRDSKQPDGTHLAVGRQAWTLFTRHLKTGTSGD
jgi:Domain of unknown function (DUF397)